MWRESKGFGSAGPRRRRGRAGISHRVASLLPTAAVCLLFSEVAAMLELAAAMLELAVIWASVASFLSVLTGRTA